MKRHAGLPTLIITDKGSVFNSQALHEIAEVLVINLKHATTKHAQTRKGPCYNQNLFENGVGGIQ